MEKTNKSKYYLFIDECGDHNLAKYDPGFPVFTLCGILVSRMNLKALNKAFEDFLRFFEAQGCSSSLTISSAVAPRLGAGGSRERKRPKLRCALLKRNRPKLREAY